MAEHHELEHVTDFYTSTMPPKAKQPQLTKRTSKSVKQQQPKVSCGSKRKAKDGAQDRNASEAQSDAETENQVTRPSKRLCETKATVSDDSQDECEEIELSEEDMEELEEIELGNESTEDEVHHIRLMCFYKINTYRDHRETMV